MSDALRQIETPAAHAGRPTTGLLVVIVNYRTADLVIDCLRSLVPERAAASDLRVVVTDNASGDDSVARIGGAIEREGWADWVTLQALARNGGFSYGNNAAIRPALAGEQPPDLVWLLNPDTIVQPGATAELVRFLIDHDEAGIAGSALLDPDGSSQGSARRMFSPISELLSGARLGLLNRLLARYEVALPTPPEPAECDWITGASFMVRSRVLREVGLLDEAYFLYFDEVDLCMRARRAGWSIWIVPSSRVVHLEGASTQMRGPSRRRPRYWYESRRRLLVKTYGVTGLVVADLLWGIGRLSLQLRRLLRLGGDTRRDPPHFARDLLWGDLEAIVTGRAHLRDRGPQGVDRR